MVKKANDNNALQKSLKVQQIFSNSRKIKQRTHASAQQFTILVEHLDGDNLKKFKGAIEWVKQIMDYFEFDTDSTNVEPILVQRNAFFVKVEKQNTIGGGHLKPNLMSLYKELLKQTILYKLSVKYHVNMNNLMTQVEQLKACIQYLERAYKYLLTFYHSSHYLNGAELSYEFKLLLVNMKFILSLIEFFISKNKHNSTNKTPILEPNFPIDLSIREIQQEPRNPKKEDEDEQEQAAQLLKNYLEVPEKNKNQKLNENYHKLLNKSKKKNFFGRSVLTKEDHNRIEEYKQREQKRKEKKIKNKENAEAEAEANRLKTEANAEENRLKTEANAEENRLKTEANAEENRLEAEANAEEKAKAKAEANRLKTEEANRLKTEANRLKTEEANRLKANAEEANRLKANAEEANRLKANAEEKETNAKSEANRIQSEKEREALARLKKAQNAITISVQRKLNQKPNLSFGILAAKDKARELFTVLGYKKKIIGGQYKTRRKKHRKSRRK
jgi:chemotaxis protein histidine kinase CheA